MYSLTPRNPDPDLKKLMNWIFWYTIKISLTILNAFSGSSSEYTTLKIIKVLVAVFAAIPTCVNVTVLSGLKVQ